MFVEEEYDAEVVVNTKPKMSWDEEESDDNNTNTVKEDWDDSEEEEETPKKVEQKEAAAPVKKNLTLKQKIAEKEAMSKEQKAKKIALVNRYIHRGGWSLILFNIG